MLISVPDSISAAGKGRDGAASEASKGIGYSPGFSSTFGSWELFAASEGVGVIPRFRTFP
jgi:hypothetical protein